MELLKETSKALIDDKPAPDVAFQYLRKAAKEYLAHIPGSGVVIDLTFNHLDAIIEQHREQATEHLKQAYSDFLRIVQHGKNKHESHTTLEVLAVCKRLAEDIGGLGINPLEIPKESRGTAKIIIEKAAKVKSHLDEKTAPIGTIVGGFFENLQGKLKGSESMDQVTGKVASQVLSNFLLVFQPRVQSGSRMQCAARPLHHQTQRRLPKLQTRKGKQNFAENHRVQTQRSTPA